MSKEFQFTLRVPSTWMPEIEKKRVTLSRPGAEASRTDALRVLLREGLDAMKKRRG